MARKCNPEITNALYWCAGCKDVVEQRLVKKAYICSRKHVNTFWSGVDHGESNALAALAREHPQL
jgi:hypothetical protein